jgi:CheY-like chemotaxis protein
VLLPRSNAASPTAAAVTESTAEAKLSVRVLLVEDNDEVAEITLHILEQLGCCAERARSAAQALEMFSGSRFDLVVSDIVMPGGMNGLELARRLRDQKPALPILLTTGYSSAVQELTREQFRILPKPYRRDQLTEAVLGAVRP